MHGPFRHTAPPQTTTKWAAVKSSFGCVLLLNQIYLTRRIRHVIVPFKTSLNSRILHYKSQDKVLQPRPQKSLLPRYFLNHWTDLNQNFHNVCTFRNLVVLFYCHFIWFYLTCLSLINGEIIIANRATNWLDLEGHWVKDQGHKNVSQWGHGGRTIHFRDHLHLLFGSAMYLTAAFVRPSVRPSVKLMSEAWIL